MATKKENIKALFSNTRTRIIIVFTLVLIAIMMIIGFIKLSGSKASEGPSGVSRGPAGISSIPGSRSPTAQYAALQETQNVEQAVEAEKKGKSAIPTIIRSQAFGEGVEAVGAQGGEGSVGFATLARENLAGPQSNVWYQNLKDHHCDSDSLDQAIKQGAVIKDLKEVCTCQQLKQKEFSLSELKTVCPCPDLRALGFGAKQLKEVGFCADELRVCGYTACEEKGAGFSPDEMKNAGFSDGQLSGAGFTPEQIARAGGLPDGVTLADVQKAGCSIENLRRLRSSGVTAAAVRRISGCSVDAMKAAGFSALDLKSAGFTAAELKSAGFKPDELRQAGFTPKDLLTGGFSAAELKAAGVSDAEIANAIGGLPPGISANDVKKAGCTVEALQRLRAAGVSAASIQSISGCGAAALKAAGFSALDLAKAGFAESDLASAGFTPTEIAAAKAAASAGSNCSPASLKAAHDSGVSAETIRRTLGCSAAALKNAGYSALDLKNAGFTAAELKNLGFSASDLKNAGFSPKDLRAAGFSANELKAAGFDAASLKDAGFSAAELKASGFSTQDLKTAGFSPAELKQAGATAAELKQAGFSAADIKAAGASAAELKAAGFSSEDLQSAGFSSKDSALAGLEEIKPNVTALPSIAGVAPNKHAELQAENAKKLEKILAQQKIQMADQKYQQKVQQRTGVMLAASNQALQEWKNSPTQAMVASTKSEEEAAAGKGNDSAGLMLPGKTPPSNMSNSEAAMHIKMGDVMFAVIDTSVDSDEPGPILATIVSGKLKGSKLIGTFNLPPNSDKLVISFNAMSIPGAPKSVTIAAFAIDPNTARTALASETDHHYMSRYGALFASTFLEGFGNAFQSADTTITIGGTGGTQDTTVQNGIGRSALENAVIGLATVGKAWGQVAQQGMSRPTTVQVFSGTGIGVLFTQNVTIM